MSPASVGAGPAEGQAAAPTATTAIRSISVAANGPALVVTIEATGALPLPTVGDCRRTAAHLFRFPGRRAEGARTHRQHGSAHPAHTGGDPQCHAARDPRRAGPRRASAVPLGAGGGTRQRDRRRVRGSVIAADDPGCAAPDGPAVSSAPREPAPEPLVAAPAVPREPALPGTQPPAPARPSAPADAPAPPSSSGQLLPAKDLEGYRPRVSPVLDRLRRLRPLLTSLDAAEDQTVERVQLAVEELERIRQELAGIKPPETLRSQHDMLLQATTLALMATRLRLEAFRTSDPATLRNARSPPPARPCSSPGPARISDAPIRGGRSSAQGSGP